MAKKAREPKIKPTKVIKAEKVTVEKPVEKPIAFPSKTLAFKVTEEESAAFHAAAGPGKASKIMRQIIQAIMAGHFEKIPIKGLECLQVPKPTAQAK